MQDSEEPMSHVKWLIWRARAMANDYGWDWLAQELNYLNVEGLKKAIGRGRDVRLPTAEAIAEICGLTIAEAMLAPEITNCEWYVYADRKYFADNMKMLAEEYGSNAALAKAIKSYSQVVQKYTAGETEPRLNLLQKMADNLNMEVADLFLPTE